MTIITLTTDFGIGDHEAGVLKGVIWSIAAGVQIADLSHEIARHDILEAALLLWRAVPYFPAGTIHVAVVDPGVGTSRHAMAARLGDQYFVGPDNGLITLFLERVEETSLSAHFVSLDQPEFWLPDVSNIFHGRDIFAPVSAHLASGVPLTELGSDFNNPVRLGIPKAVRTSEGWHGEVIHIDHFGNLETNIRAAQYTPTGKEIIHIKGSQIDGIVSTFGDRSPGTLVALFDSNGLLAISIVNGNCAKQLNAGIGDPVEVIARSEYAR